MLLALVDHGMIIGALYLSPQDLSVFSGGQAPIEASQVHLGSHPSVS
jgi:hypothetical protein